jgi:preprotein translocase subunit SecD
MRRAVTWTVYLLIFVCTAYGQAQANLSIRAASSEPIEGWSKMQVEHSTRTVWVSPTTAVVAGDIQEAHPQLRSDGDTVINIVFTDTGAQKVRDLTTAQKGKLIALVVDDRVIWAPVVQSAAGKTSVLTGSGPHGLTQEEVERIMAILR